MTPKQAKILSHFTRQFAELVCETLTAFVEEKEIKNQLPSSPPAQLEKRFLNRKEIAARLGVSVGTVANLIKKGLPTVPLGEKRIQFDLDDVMTWAKDKRFEGRGKTNLRVVS